jgi:hypothetical protein
VADVQARPVVLLSCAALGLVDCAGVCCATGEVCEGGLCLGPVAQAGEQTNIILLNECAAQGLADCGGYCADIEIDLDNCGSCGVVCGPSEGCLGGTCVAPPARGCTTVQTDCGTGYCVALSSDWSHCGSCEHGCFGGTTCQNYQCV